jgi:transposase InsO family protein
MSAMDQKIQFIADWQSQNFSLTDLSQKYGISRPTVYKLIGRYEQSGVGGLKEQSRTPKTCPHRTPNDVLDLLIKEKLKNRKRGPKKIRAQLQRQYSNIHLPASSTIAYWLKKQGLVEKRKKRLRVPPYTKPFIECTAPNDVWSIDYKGQFHMKNGHHCYPLTVSDNFSRFLLGCKALKGPCYNTTRRYLESLFREYGLPDAIRTDNGTPFAGKATGGFSRLSIWFILLGVTPERIEKGCPQQNGRHERMHRTLKNDILDSVGRNLKEQQNIFDIFRNDFNYARPHESLKDLTPSDYYKRSDRPFVQKPHPFEYGYDHIIRRVRHSGEIRFMGSMFFISRLLTGRQIGLKEIADGIWQLQFSFYVLGSVDLRKNKIIRN